MALISFAELVDMVIMTLGVGFIFMDAFFPKQHQQYDPLKQHNGFDWHALGFAALVTAPAVIFHELAHKFVAMGMGLQATFHAAYMWLGIGILLKVLNTGFIFFVPGYVSTVGATPLQHSLIAFAGPFLNLVLFGVSWLVLQSQRKMSHKAHTFWIVSKRINGFLFVFNILPIPGFDGSHVLRGLLEAF